MGKEFGNLIHAGRLVYYGLSPNEQRAFAGAISKGLPNMFRRFTGQVFRVAPPLIFGYMLYDWGEKANYQSARKNVEDFANDE